MPAPEDISEEGFGFFRDTWFIRRASVTEAASTVHLEGELINWLDRVAASSQEYELLASALEDGATDLLPGRLHAQAVGFGLDDYLPDPDDFSPLDGLEIGVAGLTYALSAIQCLTAASCRWHVREDSWSDCPVVFFAAPDWRVHILAELVAQAGCGLDHDRGLLTVYGGSIRDTHRLAARILAERGRFRRRPAE